MRDVGDRIGGLVRIELWLRLLFVLLVVAVAVCVVVVRPPAEVAGAVAVIMGGGALAVARSPVATLAALLEKLR